MSREKLRPRVMLKTSKMKIHLLVILNILYLLLAPLALFAFVATKLVPYHGSQWSYQVWLSIDFFYAFIYPFIGIKALIVFFMRRHKKNCPQRIFNILVRPLLIGSPYIFLFIWQMLID